MKLTKNRYLNYFGKNYNYYKSQIDNSEIKKWNWASFFLGYSWLIYRNLYFFLIFWCFIDLIIYTIKNQLETFGLFNLLMSFIFLFIEIIIMIIFGFFGNKICISKFLKTKKLNNKSFNRKIFIFKKIGIISCFIIVMLSINFSIDFFLEILYRRTVFTIENTYMFIKEPIFTSLPDNSTLIAYRTYEKNINDLGKLIILKRKNNKIIFKKELDDIKPLNYRNSQFYQIPNNSNMYILIITEDEIILYKLNQNYILIHKEAFPENDYIDSYFNENFFEIIYKSGERTFKIKYDLILYTKHEEIIKEDIENYKKIQLSNLYYNEKLIKDYEFEVTLFNENKEKLFKFNYNTQEDRRLEDILKYGDKILVVFESKIFIIDYNINKFEKIELNKFELGFVDTFNKGNIKLWGITETFYGDKLTLYQIDKFFKLSKKIFYTINLKYTIPHNLVGKYDKNNNKKLIKDW